jgi:hypothetical protein
MHETQGVVSILYNTWSTQPPIQGVPGVKRPGRESGHSPQSSYEVKNAWNYTSTPQYLYPVIFTNNVNYTLKNF